MKWYEHLIALIPAIIVTAVYIHACIEYWRNPGLREQIQSDRKYKGRTPSAIVRNKDEL